MLVRILLVADKPQAEKFVLATLSKHWWGRMSLECKPNFSQALDCLQSESFDAMLVDLAVPDLQHPEGLTRVGAIAHTLPIILLIDSAETDRLITAARNLGIRNWLSKDTLTPSRLAEAVRSALAVHENQEGVS